MSGAKTGKYSGKTLLEKQDLRKTKAYPPSPPPPGEKQVKYVLYTPHIRVSG